MRVLGIETSCDETAVAIYDGDRGLLAHELYSQVDLHAPYGGVVPELASRDHLRKLLPLLEESARRPGRASERVDGVAYTSGPGLVGALLVGAAVARSLAYAWQRAGLGVHHMEGAPAGAAARTRPAAVPVRGVAGVRAATRCLPEVDGLGPLRAARQIARRRGRRSFRQDRQAARSRATPADRSSPRWRSAGARTCSGFRGR